MIARNLHRLKVAKGGLQTTSFAGIPLLTELAHHAGLVDRLDAVPDLWDRRGLYATSDYVLGLAMTLIAGGEGLDDTRMLRADAGLKQLAFPSLPAANSFGRFLRRFGRRSLYRLGRTVSALALKNVRPGKTLTLDLDATLIESDKKRALATYKGFDGYNPVLAWLAEPDVFLAGVFRDGNASPQSHLTSLLRYCRGRLPKGTKLRVRSDSAGYRTDFIAECVRSGYEFTVAADLDCSVREAIENIPEKAWQLVVRGEDTFLLAETVHAFGRDSFKRPLPAFRLIVKRELSGQLELFKDPLKHHVILTNLPGSMTALEVLGHYNARGTAEKMIGELKNGYGLDRLPCASLAANAAFFQVCLLAYNLVATFKRFALPEGWRSFCVKNLRFRLLNQAAIVVRHARRLVLKLSEGFPHFREFENARWSVLAPALSP